MRNLIQTLKKNKPKAQKVVYEKYADYLYRLCFRYMGNKEEAEEVLMQGFFKIFNEVSKTDIEEELVLRAWMKKVMVNQALMAIRQKGCFTYSLDVVEEIEESELYTDEKLLESDLIEMIMQLPDGYRTVFSLHVIEGYKHEEIASQLNISVGTSKSQLSKARRLLKEMITKTEVCYEKIY